MAATTTRSSRAARGAEKPAQDAGQQASQPQAQPEPATTIETVQVPYYRPTVTFPDGRAVTCGHRYMHENEKAARTCGRKIAAHGEFVK